MTSARRIVFGPFHLDLDAAELWKGDAPVALQPRPLAVLGYLAERRGEVVPRDELIKALWAGTFVTKAVLKVAVRAIREALDDDVDAPRYIETVGHEGYRFIGGDPAAAARPLAPADATATAMVGRAEDLARLSTAFEHSLDGIRRIVFVTGEAGIGKTTLVQRFLDEVKRDGRAWVARGQCLEQYGEGEPYLPVLEAIGRLVREDGRNELAGVLRRHAPTWLPQLPALTENDAATVAEAPAMPIPARMLREMADALEVFTRGRALVIVLEDLHWSDRSTIDLLASLARRREAARLLVIGTYRPADVIIHDHPLRAAKQELQATGQCEEVPLELLSDSDVAAYVDARLAPADAADDVGPSAELRRLAARIYERTEGNALFMVNVVNDLIAQGRLVQRDGRWQIDGSIDHATERIPAGLHELIARRLDRLAPEVRRTLEVASVAGEEFTVAAVAAGLERDVGAVEDVCEELAATRALIADAGVAEWPDGSVSGQYRFLHSLYRHVLYERLGEVRRVRLHRVIGTREETAWAGRTAERAAELAMHFERGRDHAQALRYHQLAASAALERHAAHEAVAHLTAALEALERQPDLADRAERTLELEVARATLLMATKGYAAPEVAEAYSRSRALCAAMPATRQAYPVLRGLVSYHHVRAELVTGAELGELLLRHAARDVDDVALRVQAHYGHGATLFHLGELTAAREHLQRALADYDPSQHREHIRVYGGYDPGVASSFWLAWTLLFLGHLDEAARYERAGLDLARRLADPFTRTWAANSACATHQMRGEWAASEEHAAEAAALAVENGFPYLLATSTVNRGWAMVMQRKLAIGARLLRDGIAAVEATGAALVRPVHLAMLAGIDAMGGDLASAAERFDRALAEIERTGERVHEVAVLIAKSRLVAAADEARGKKRRRADRGDAAEVCLRRALEVARGQEARLLELRAAIAFARHCRARGRGAEGRDTLAGVLAWFEDTGATARDVTSARELLLDLG